MELAGIDSFHLFPLLPNELRLRIFKIASLKPRILNLLPHPHRSFTHPPATGGPLPEGWKVQYFFSPDPVLATLRVCRESRLEIESLLTKAFTADPTDGPRYTWTNFGLDTIRIKYDCFAAVKDEDKSAIFHLIVDCPNGNLFNWFHMYDYRNMRQLKDLTIITVDEVSWWVGELEYLWQLAEGQFGGEEGWVCPDIKIMNEETGAVMDRRNYAELSKPAKRGRGRGRGR